MKPITVNSISNKYEQLYKTFLENSSADECFYAVNNAMIFAYFVNYISTSYSKETQDQCYEEIVEKYGIDIFFHNIKKTEKYKSNRDYAIEIFTELFGNNIDDDNSSLEKVLGNVLEKHINRKDTGSYYTPDDTTRYISERAIVISMINKCNEKMKKSICSKLGMAQPTELINESDVITKLSQCGLTDKEIDFLLSTLYEMKIIDPTCGSGAFVVAAFECIEKIVTSFQKTVDYNRLFNCLYGLDISKEAVQLTKLRMLMRIVNKNVDLMLFAKTFDKNFKVADAIKGSDYVIEEDGFDWKDFGSQFDCIIGNPPYVEASGYASSNFVTNRCGNLYAYVIERACNIATDKAMISFIVPLPFVATPRMQTAKRYLESNSNNVFYGTFADRPGCIFTGVHQRLTIFFAEMGNSGKCDIYSSAYNYWYNDERSELFNNIKYYKNEIDGILPKIGNEVEFSIYKKLMSGANSLFDLWVEESDYSIFLSTRIGFWTKAFKENVFSSSEFKEYKAETDKWHYLSLAILNSSAFYYLWVVTSDCWHITNKNISDFKFDISKARAIDFVDLSNLVDELMKDLERNKKYIGSKQTAYEYKHKYSKSIIDKIDDILAPIFGFTNEELGYVKSFTEKYRLNKLEA